jgi:chromosome partitioning protein
MSTIIALAGQKGGSGKTTTALTIAAEWHARHRRVLLVDADPQGSTRTWGDLAAEGGHAAPTIVAMGAGLHRPDQLPALAKSYDFVVIDCPPRHGTVLRSALMVANLALLPCGPSAVDAWALGETLDLIAEARTLRPELQAAVVLTRKIARTVLGDGARVALAECGLPILRAELGYRVAYQEAPAAGLGVTVYEPGGAAAEESRRLVDELESMTIGERRHALA